ncbi:hypothetical protein ABG768_000366 [Culter alburnus]|uniref:Cysteine-rich protein 1 n=1 Tax=Culter alburnus TaxID=194366 RepID=A0AAW2B5X5_CULAL
MSKNNLVQNYKHKPFFFFFGTTCTNNEPCEKKRSLGRDYHPLCLKCHKCKRQLTPGQHAEHDEKPYCTNCYMRDFGPRGSRNPVARTFNTAAS